MSIWCYRENCTCFFSPTSNAQRKHVQCFSPTSNERKREGKKVQFFSPTSINQITNHLNWDGYLASICLIEGLGESCNDLRIKILNNLNGSLGLNSHSYGIVTVHGGDTCEINS